MFYVFFFLVAVSFSEECTEENILSNWECDPEDRVEASYDRALQDNFTSSQPGTIFPGIFNITAINETFHSLSDLYPGAVKATHSIGSFGVVRVDWCDRYDYTGLFTGNNYMLMRFSYGTVLPTVIGDFVYSLPNFGLKQFRKGRHSGTLQNGGRGKTPESTTSFFVDGANHFKYVGDFVDIFFSQIAPPTATGLRDFAAYKENGQEVPNPRYPWMLIYQASPIMAARFNRTSTTFLQDLYNNININDELFKIYFVREPPSLVNGTIVWSRPVYGGKIVAKERFIPSLWGDGQTRSGVNVVGGGFFLNHKSFADDITGKPEFGPAYDQFKWVEDADSYQPLPSYFSYEATC